MRVLLAPDSFKGCLSSVEVCNAVEAGIKLADKEIDVVQFPSSDGGEGFCDCMRNIFGGEAVTKEVTFPLGNKGLAEFIYNRGTKTAYIELASASGLPLVPEERRNIMASSTLGTGELIISAIELGATTIVLGLGGSATNDCGIGILYALGMRFFDANRNELLPNAESLDKVVRVDKEGMLDLSGIEFIAACDVKNPLCGRNGAAEVFSRQKGANEEEVKRLDKACLSFASVLGIDPDIPGSGAAGGVGAAVLSMLNGRYVSGATMITDSKAFDAALAESDLLITGEGNTDAQTSCGKLVSVILASAQRAGIPSIVLSGGLSEGYESLSGLGAIGFYALKSDDVTLEYCITHARELLAEKACQIIREYKEKASV